VAIAAVVALFVFANGRDIWDFVVPVVVELTGAQVIWSLGLFVVGYVAGANDWMGRIEKAYERREQKKAMDKLEQDEDES